MQLALHCALSNVLQQVDKDEFTIGKTSICLFEQMKILKQHQFMEFNSIVNSFTDLELFQKLVRALTPQGVSHLISPRWLAWCNISLSLSPLSLNVGKQSTSVNIPCGLS